MEIVKRHISDTEVRLVVLECVRALGQADDVQLWQFIAGLDVMDYITMQLRLHELLDGGEVQQGFRAMQQRFLISEKGLQALALFGERIPASVAQAIAQRAPAYRAQMLEKRQVSAVYELARKGDYRVLMRLIEDELPMLLLRLKTQKKRLAEQAKAAFALQASSIIAYGYSLAMQDEPPIESDGVVRLSTTEYRVSAELDTEQAALHWELTLPNEPAAHALAAACHRRGAEIGQELLRLLAGQ